MKIIFYLFAFLCFYKSLAKHPSVNAENKDTIVHQSYLFEQLNTTKQINTYQIKNFIIEQNSQVNYIAGGILIGLNFLIFVVNIFYYFSTKEKLFLRFCFYLTIVLISQILLISLIFPSLLDVFPIYNTAKLLFALFCLFALTHLYFQELTYPTSQILMGLKWIKLIFFILSLFVFIFSFFEINDENQPINFIITGGENTLFIIYSIGIISLIYNGLKSNNSFNKIISATNLLRFLIVINLFFFWLKAGNHQANIQQHTLISFSSLFVFDLFFFCYLLALRYKTIANENNQLNLEIAKNKQTIHKNMIEVLELERIKIAEKLEKNINSILKKIIVILPDFENSNLKTETIKIFNDLIDKFEQINYNFLPNNINKIRLDAHLISMVEKLNQSQGIHFELELPEYQPLLKQGVEIQIIKIINELITNILKHSKSDKAQITIAVKDNQFECRITDNGIGFEPNDKQEGIGLKNIKSRLFEIGGTIKISSSDKGTSLYFQVPI